MLGCWPGITAQAQDFSSKIRGKALMPENMPWEAHCQQTVE